MDVIEFRFRFFDEIWFEGYIFLSWKGWESDRIVGEFHFFTSSLHLHPFNFQIIDNFVGFEFQFEIKWP